METPNPTNGAASPVSLESEVATVAEELYELFAQPDTQTDDRQSEALARYVRSIGRVGIVASANGRRPVKDACIAFQDRLKVLAASGQRLSPRQRELLEAWPIQLMACLSVPVDPVAVDALIALLRSEEWREPMTEAEAAALRGAFLPAAAAGVVQEPPRERSPAETADAAVEAAVPAAADESAQPIAAPIVVGSGVIADLRRELADTMDGLNATLAAGGESVEETAATLELAGERMALLGMSAAAAGLVGMMDACTLFQGALSELAASNLPIDVEGRKAIGRWTARLDAYLLAPTEPTAIDALLDYLAVLPWGGGLGESERANLRELLLQGATAESHASEDWDEELTDRPVGAGDDAVVSVRDSSAGMAEAVSGGDAAAAGETTGSEGGGPTAKTNQSVELDWFAAAAPASGEDESGDAGEGSLDEAVEAPGGAGGNAVSGLLPDDDRSRESDWFADAAPVIGEGASDDAGDASFDEQVEIPSEMGRSEAVGPLPESDRSDEFGWFADSMPPSGEQQHDNAGETSFEAHIEASSEAPGSEESGPPREADQPAGLDWLADPVSAEDQDSTVQPGDTGRAGGVSVNEIGDQARELIELLSVELETSVERLGEQLNQMLDADADDETRRDAIDEYLAQIEPFTLASESLGLMGLSEALSCLQENLQVLRDAGALPDGLDTLLHAWPARVLSYLNTLGTPDCGAPLVALLSDPRWPHPLADSEGPGLEERLARPELIVDDQEAEPRQTVAQAEDVSLALPEDVNAQLLESLLQELPNETAEFTEAVSRMLAGGAGLEELDRAQRIAHTLKGSANTVGVVGIATLTHHIEDILLAFSKHQRLPGAALLEVLIDAADVLEMMSEALVGTGSAPDQAQAVLQRVLDWANRIDAEGLPEDDAAPPVAAAAPAGETGADEAGASAARADASAPMLRVPATLVDELLRLAGESIILNGQLQERLRHSLSQTEAAREQNRLVQQLVVELEELVDVQGLNSPQARAGLYEKFDALELEQYNELHTVTHRLVEATTDARELTHGIQDQLDDLAGMLVDQGRLNKESHEVVMRTRMVPVQTIVPRLQRSVRQTGRLTGKQAQLEVSGVDTLMDSDVLNELADPLMHILRNAIDHGIEPPEARAAAGKAPIGRIDLSFHREGDHIVLRCRDDGAGLDLDTIRRTARERGLIDGDDEPTDDVLMRLVWLPGFSTREVTTQTSGRGIGMDAVYSRVTELKGTLNIDSRAGKGCTVELRLPLTLISVHALLVRTRGQALAVSTRGVEQILHPGDGTIEHDDGQLYYQFGEARYEAHFLETLLHQPINNAGVTETERPVLLVRGETGRTSAVLVEQVGGSQDLVVKQLSQYLPSIAGIEGATILGDGSVAPVLDLAGLLRTTAPDEVAELAGRLAEESGTSQLPCALVVDDSLSARRSLAQFVQDAGFEVRTARDGLEAIDVIADRAPDVLLVDLEMPRMNGLELTAHVRARADLREVPIIMITSRSTEKHRQQAEEAGVDVYLTKPFSEDDLLGHITQRLASA